MIDPDRHQEPPATESSRPPLATTRSDRRVHEGSEESFPASDPPSYMGTRSPESGSSTRGTTDELSPERQWAVRLVRALDRREAVAASEMLAEDAIVRIGESALLVGRTQAALWLHGWLSHQGEVTRQIVDVRLLDEALFIELEVTGDTADGQLRTWPEAISVRLRRDVASRMTVYGCLPSTAPGATTDAAMVTPNDEQP